MTKDELEARLAEREAQLAAATETVARLELLAGEKDQRLAALDEAAVQAEAANQALRGEVSTFSNRVAELVAQFAAVSPAAAETERLAAFLLETYPEEPGRGNPQEGESAVDVAIRLLQPAEPVAAFAPSVVVQAALAEHLDEQGVTDAPAQAALVVRHLVDYARGTGALPGKVVNALLKLSP